jgi:hypothetical protein
MFCRPTRAAQRTATASPTYCLAEDGKRGGLRYVCTTGATIDEETEPAGAGNALSRYYFEGVGLSTAFIWRATPVARRTF